MKHLLLLVQKNIILYLIILTLIGGVLRFYGNTQNPVSLNIDEVAIGYNAYSILKTGRDEHGIFMPLSFKSVGDYKAPVLIYLTVPSVAIFGLNEFSVRFPTALMATLSIFLSFFLFKKITNNLNVSLFASFLLTISPWHIYFSRYASESMVATVFTMLGIFCFLKMLDKGVFWAVGSALFLSLAMYTYHSHKLFIPLFMFLLAVINYKKINNLKKEFIILILTGAILVAPLIFFTIFGNDKTRAQETFITRDADYLRNVLVAQRDTHSILDPLLKLFNGELILLFFYWLRKYLNYFQPTFLFFNGLNLTSPNTYGMGVLYLFELPLILIGSAYLLYKKNQGRLLIIIWILIGLLPASLTQNEQHALRSLVALPAFILVSAYGGVNLFKYLGPLSVFKRTIFIGIASSIVIWNLLFFLVCYAVYFPYQRDEDFMGGTREAVEYALSHKDEYKEIVFDPKRGTLGPYIVSIPYMYILFYSKYDPATYQSLDKQFPNDVFKFDKFTIRTIDWRVDRSREGVLFIGSHWMIPEQDIKGNGLKKRINLTNGMSAFLIVSPDE